jgi:NAD(P)H-hydrate epimerase
MRREDLPALTVAQMRDVNHWLVEEMGIAVLQLHENTGANFARLLIERFGRVPVVVLAGRGSNGAGGLATARHLVNRGVSTRIILAQPLAGMSPGGAHQLETDRAMGIKIYVAPEPNTAQILGECGVVVDALTGYSLSGQPMGETARLVSLAMASGKPIASLDVPSGTNPDTGDGYDPHIRATLTMAIAVPKLQSRTDAGREVVGELYVSDVSMPEGLYRRLGYEGPLLFADQPVIRLE